MKSPSRQKPLRVIKATKELQVRTGTGVVPVEKIRQAERVIGDNAYDFVPMAEGFLKQLKTALSDAKLGKGVDAARVENMTRPVMEMKANAGMFQYGLVSTLAGIMLGFLERVKHLDKDAIDIVEAHHKTLALIIARRIRGEGGETGVLLKAELEDAVERYFAKLERKTYGNKTI